MGRKWKIWVFGKPVQVEEVDMNYFNDESASKYGAVDCREGKIWVANNQLAENKLETLIHEVIHIFCDEMKIELEEQQIQQLALGFFLLCKENDINIKKLMRGKDG